MAAGTPPSAESGILELDCGSLAKWVVLRRHAPDAPETGRDEICALMASGIHRVVRGQKDGPALCLDQQTVRAPAGEVEALYVEATWDDAAVRRCAPDLRTWSRVIQVQPNQAAAAQLRPLNALELYGGMHCPYARFLGPHGAPEPPFVVLDNRQGASRAGTDRIDRRAVAVLHGRVALRLEDVEPEISRIDSIALEVDGRMVPPSPATTLPLHLRQGDRIDVTFDVPWLADGAADVTLVVSGYYDRL